MINIKAAFTQLICGTCDKAKKYKGDKKTENGIRNNFMVDDESTMITVFTVSYHYHSSIPAKNILLLIYRTISRNG